MAAVLLEANRMPRICSPCKIPHIHPANPSLRLRNETPLAIADFRPVPRRRRWGRVVVLVARGNRRSGLAHLTAILRSASFARRGFKMDSISIQNA